MGRGSDVHSHRVGIRPRVYGGPDRLAGLIHGRGRSRHAADLVRVAVPVLHEPDERRPLGRGADPGAGTIQRHDRAGRRPDVRGDRDLADRRTAADPRPPPPRGLAARPWVAADECACSRLCHDTAVSPSAAQRSAKLVKQRVDELLVELGLADTRSKAQALVMAGKVRIGEGDGARRDVKPGDRIPRGTRISIDEPEPYVGRGGYKLAAALDAFGIDPAHKVALDVGASTGGFTDVLLQRGARHVYALDVGRGQLAGSLRGDARVTSMERTNARTLTAGTLTEPVDLAV